MRLRAPEVGRRLARQVAARRRPSSATLGLYKPPGVAETIDWARALHALGATDARRGVGRRHARPVVKYREDAQRVPRPRHRRASCARGGRPWRLTRPTVPVDGARRPRSVALRPACCAPRGLRGARRGRPSPTPRPWRRSADRRRRPAPTGRPGHARAPARGHRRLRPGLRRLLRRRRAGAADRGRRAVPVEVVARRRRRRRRRAATTATSDDADAGTDVRRCAGAPTEVLRHKDLAACTRRRAGRGPPADGRPAARRRPPPQPRGAGRPRAGPGPARPAPHGPPARCAPAARSVRPGHHRARASGPAGSCCCSTSAGRWSPTPGRSSASPTPPSPAAAGARSRRSPSAPGSPASPASWPPTTPTPPCARAADAVADWSGGTRLGEGLRAFNDRGASGAWPGARWS